VYGVVAKREGSWWVLAIDSLGIAGQVRHLDEGESVGRDLIAAFLDVPGEQVSVELEVILPEEAVKFHQRDKKTHALLVEVP